jgi:glutamine synthetase adenylyltransferase
LTRTELAAAFDAAIGALKDRAHKLNAVRRAARREVLRIGVSDLAGGRPIQFIASDLSILADVCLHKMIDILMPELEARYGTLPGRQTASALSLPLSDWANWAAWN